MEITPEIQKWLDEKKKEFEDKIRAIVRDEIKKAK